MKYFCKEEILGFMDDKEWHDAYEFLGFLRDVPPEKATRAYANLDGNKTTRERRKREPYDKQISYGKLVIVRKYMSHLMRSGLIERNGRGLAAKYRKK